MNDINIEKIKCPACGSMARREGMKTCTAMYYPRSYDENGNEISNNCNTTKTENICTTCGTIYYTYN